MAASPWPMPEVSTTTRSKPAHLAAAITSGSAALISLPNSRVAKERMKTREPCCQGEMAFMRMRSPKSAPPLLRRDGSIEITAIRIASFWSKRKRRINSSVNDDLPAPPVPVMPMTGTLMAAASAFSCARKPSMAGVGDSSAVMSCANARQLLSVWPCIALSVVGA